MSVNSLNFLLDNSIRAFVIDVRRFRNIFVVPGTTLNQEQSRDLYLE